LLHFPAGLIPLLFLIYVQTLLGISKERKQIWIKRCVALGSFFFVPFYLTRFFSAPAVPKCGFDFYFQRGPLYDYYIASFCLTIAAVFFLLWKGYRKSTGLKRTQISHTLLAYGLGYGGGLMVILPDYNLSMPWWAVYCIPLAHFWLFYAILRHRLLD